MPLSTAKHSTQAMWGVFLFPQTPGTISAGRSPLERGGGECSPASAEAKRSAERNSGGVRYNEKRSRARTGVLP